MKKLCVTLLVAILNLFQNLVLSQTAYVTNDFDNTVSVINVATNTVTATIPVGNYPRGASVSPDGTKVYITNGNSNTVSVINTATNTVTATIPVGNYPTGVCVSPDGSKVYICNYNGGTVSVINTATNSVSATIAAGTYPDWLSISPDGSKVYFENNISAGTVKVLNTPTNTVSVTIPVGYYPIGVSVSPDGSKVYVANSFSGNVSVINTVTNAVVANVLVGSHPFGVSVSPDGSKVYVANNYANTVSVINTLTNTVTSTISVGNQPYGLSVSSDGSKVYVTNHGSNTVSVINATADTVSATIVVGLYPASIGNFITPYTAPIIHTASINTLFCAGTNISVPFTTSDTLNPTNIFTAQLSNASGSFASPVNIGTLADTVSGTITATIPTGTPAGTGYRIRVTSSNPAATGADNGTNITINPTYTNTVSASICQGSTYTFPDGSVDSINTVHTSHLQSIHTCDSTVVTTLTTNPTYTNSVSASICQGRTYTFPDGSVDSINTVHTSHLQSIHTCDSSIVTTLTVTIPNVGIHLEMVTCTCPSWLVVDSAATSYQWIDCNNSNAIIPGETDSIYTVIYEGNYAVIINQNGCIDTSSCYYVLATGTTEINNQQSAIEIYPNPCAGELRIKNAELRIKEVRIYNVLGLMVNAQWLMVNEHSATVDVSGLSKGIYFVEIKTEKGVVRKKIIKE